MKRRPSVRIALDCACGGTARGRFSPPSAYTRIKAAFVAAHGGRGCRVAELTLCPTPMVISLPLLGATCPGGPGAAGTHEETASRG